MNFFSIAFKVVVLICLVILITLFRRSFEEAETMYSIYPPMHNEIAETECYQTFPEPLKLQMAKLDNRVSYHYYRSYNYKSIANGLTIFCFILAVVFTFLEIRSYKKNQEKR